jgi:predicted metal-dependent hydrolase
MMKAPHSTPYFLDVKGQLAPLPIIVSMRKGARSLVLRYQPLTHALMLTLPPHVSVKKGLQFVERKRDWVLQQLEKRPEKISFVHDSVVPVLGREYRLKHAGGRGVVRKEEGIILVPGEAAFMARRLRDWLKKLARKEIMRLAAVKAKELNRRINKITLRDTRSLWGSCTQNGNLSFSWRLVFAPPDVLDYLVSHEVAHLVELNHSARSWNIVESLCPHFQQSRTWLRKHGDSLYRYG